MGGRRELGNVGHFAMMLLWSNRLSPGQFQRLGGLQGGRGGGGRRNLHVMQTDRMKKEVQTIMSILADACLSAVQQQVRFSSG